MVKVATPVLNTGSPSLGRVRFLLLPPSMPFVVHMKRDRYDVYVGRPTLWGNKFEIGKDGTREEVIAKYEQWVRDRPGFVEMVKRELRGKVLGCWCSPKACHGDVLARIANE